MKTPEENNIYGLFRTRLDNPDQNPFDDDSWDKMEDLLDKQNGRKRGIIWLYRASTGIAAALLLFAGFYLLKPVTAPVNRIVKSTVNHLPNGHNDKGTNQIKQQSIVPSNTDLPGQTLITLQTKHRQKENAVEVTHSTAKAVTPAGSPVDSINPADSNLAALNPAKISTDNLPAESILAADLTMHMKPTAGTGKVTKTAPGMPRQLTLSVLAAPDVNSINSIDNSSRTGTNIGLQLSMQLSKRFSISSGATYGSKPYQTGTANYTPQTANWWAKKFGTTGKPDQVTADCKVLDIPLNINYQLFIKGSNKLTLGTGVSSYFMLSEAYHFTFSDPSVNSTDFKINNRNQHIFGLVNLNATYERKVNNRLGIVLQPYMKLPITQIGFGQVSLRSTGIAAGLSWNINSSKGK